MSNKTIGYNHLIRNIPNTGDNRNLIKEINKMMKESNSQWKLHIRYRKPIVGSYSWGGSVKKDNANAFSLYLTNRTGVISREDKVRNESIREGWSKYRELLRKVEHIETIISKALIER